MSPWRGSPLSVIRFGLGSSWPTEQVDECAPRGTRRHGVASRVSETTSREMLDREPSLGRADELLERVHLDQLDSPRRSERGRRDHELRITPRPTDSAR